MTRIEKRLRVHAGLELPVWVIESRAQARMRALSLDGDAYADLISGPRGAAELVTLLEAVRVGETSFFRHRAQMEAVAEVVVRAWAEQGVRSPRVWSAGCASGEEPYTLALVLSHLKPMIVATDLSDDALRVARIATYPVSVLAKVPDAYRSGFEVDGTFARVKPEVARLVTFETKNLAAGDQPRGFHLVFCRNVLIYFDAASRARAIDKLVGSLLPGGFLFVGYSETLRDVAGLTPVRHGEQVFWRRAIEPTSARVTPASSLARAPRTDRAASRPTRPAPAPPLSMAHESTKAVVVFARAAAELSSDIAAALGKHGLETLHVDLDGADSLDDDTATVLRRAQAAARASGIDLWITASREGPRRWLRRHGFAGDRE